MQNNKTFYSLKNCKLPLNEEVILVDIYGGYEIGFFYEKEDGIQQNEILFNSHQTGIRYLSYDEYIYKYWKPIKEIINDCILDLDNNIETIDEHNFIAHVNNHTLKFNISKSSYKIIEIDNKKVDFKKMSTKDFDDEYKSNFHYYAWMYIRYNNDSIFQYFNSVE